jgi:hypothetical protein
MTVQIPVTVVGGPYTGEPYVNDNRVRRVIIEDNNGVWVYKRGDDGKFYFQGEEKDNL